MKPTDSKYSFTLNADNQVILKRISDEDKNSLTIPTEELLEWVNEFNLFLEKVGIKPIKTNKLQLSDEASYMDQQKQLHKSAYASWTAEDDEELTEMFHQEDFDRKAASEHFGRNTGAIQSRLKKLGLLAPKH